MNPQNGNCSGQRLKHKAEAAGKTRCWPRAQPFVVSKLVKMFFASLGLRAEPKCFLQACLSDMEMNDCLKMAAAIVKPNSMTPLQPTLIFNFGRPVLFAHCSPCSPLACLMTAVSTSSPVLLVAKVVGAAGGCHLGVHILVIDAKYQKRGLLSEHLKKQIDAEPECYGHMTCIMHDKAARRRN